jgi:hypothetical protein
MVTFLSIDHGRWTIDDESHHPWSMFYRLLYELSTLDLLFDQLTRGCEFHFHFDLLETAVVPDQSLANQIESFIPFIFKAEVIIQVHAAFDDLATAITFDLEGVVSFFGFGGSAAEEVFEEAHKSPFMSLRVFEKQSPI